MRKPDRYIYLTLEADLLRDIVAAKKGCLTIQVHLDEEGVVIDAMTGEDENVGTACKLYDDMGLDVEPALPDDAPNDAESVLAAAHCDDDALVVPSLVNVETADEPAAGGKYHVRHDQAVWETTSFDVTVPAEIPKAEHKKWIEDDIDELMSDAIEAERASISIDSQSVETCDTSITITPAEEHYG